MPIISVRWIHFLRPISILTVDRLCAVGGGIHGGTVPREDVMKSVITVNAPFATENEEQQFISRCEERFWHQVDACANHILASGCRFVTLAGPTCSGKTTASARIASAFVKRGIRLMTISIDDFYIEREVLLRRANERGEDLDLDSPDTIYIHRLAECIAGIRQRQVVDLPHYNFKIGACDRTEKVDSNAYDMILVEGIQAIYPNVRELFLPGEMFAVYIRPFSDIVAGGTLVGSHELRLTRRLVRDFDFRNASPAYTFELWRGVRKNEEIHIIPNELQVDFAIDSTMAYEPCVIRKPLLRLLSMVEASSPYAAQAAALAERFAPIPDLPEALVPGNSIFREFIGGGEK